jgi:putative flippase GtrA
MQAVAKHAGRAIKYVLVGAANTLLYAGLLYFFLEKMALGGWASVTCAYLIAMVFQYSANKYFTFEARGALTKQFTRYLISAFASYLLSLALVEICIVRLGISTGSTVLICMISTALMGYVLGYFWVYKER